MNSVMKFALGGTAAMVLAVGGELLYLHHRNNTPEPEVKTPDAYKLTDDDTVNYTLKKLRPDSLKDARELIGKTIWVSAGGQLDYYKDTGKHVDYAHPVGVLAGADPLVIKDVFEQVPPHLPRAIARISAGQRHVLLAFTLPNSADPKTLYATPVGHFEGGVYEFLNDQIFFYDDPHTLYKHWGADVWAHVDKHEVIPGMSENQAMMALGQVIVPSSDAIGDRTVTYNNNDHPIRIDFTHNKATKITPEQP